MTGEGTISIFDLVAIRALLHHLPERRAVVSRMVRWLKPGGWLFVQEPDFYPTWTVEPPSQKSFWEAFIRWADTHQIDYYVGRKLPGWMQQEGLGASPPRVTRSTTMAVRTSPDGGIMACAKWRRSCRAKAAYRPRSSTNSTLRRATPNTGP